MCIPFTNDSQCMDLIICELQAFCAFPTLNIDIGWLAFILKVQITCGFSSKNWLATICIYQSSPHSMRRLHNQSIRSSIFINWHALVLAPYPTQI